MCRTVFQVCLPAAALWVAAVLTTGQACPITRITLDDPDENARFGTALLARGDTLFVGAPGDRLTTDRRGTIYVLERSGNHWYLAQELDAHLFDPHGAAGSALACDGKTLVAGSPEAKHVFDLGGRLELFEHDGSRWRPAGRLQPRNVRGHRGYVGFGTALALAGDRILVGAPGEAVVGRRSGAVHEYRRFSDGWRWTDELIPDDARVDQLFGGALALEGDTLVVGALNDDAGIEKSEGAVYVFERVGPKWIQRQKLAPTDGSPFRQFGSAVALRGDTLVVGAPATDSDVLSSGAGFVFERRQGLWTLTERLQPVDLESRARFGHSMTLEGDVLLVGAPGLGGVGGGVLYRRGPSGWGAGQRLQPVTLENDQGLEADLAGSAVGLAGDVAFLGAPFHDQRGVDSGAVHAFSLSGTTCQTLFTERLQSYGRLRLRLDRGPEHAGHVYWLGASASGTTPGIRALGRRIPLVRDPLLQASIRTPNRGVFRNNLGLLDAQGRAEVILNIPPEAYLELVGLELDFATIEGPTTRGFEHVSNGVSVRVGKRVQ